VYILVHPSYGSIGGGDGGVVGRGEWKLVFGLCTKNK